MLIAKTEKGQMISLLKSWDKATLQKICQTEAVYCPVCNEKVRVKMGTKRIWHFSHISTSQCESQFEKESEYHRQGKISLYHWFKEQQIPVELEKYLPNTKQRPDLFFTWNKQKYAIEFQCSTIDSNLVMKRTESYLNENIQPVWILGGNRLKKTSQHKLKLTAFELLMSSSSHQHCLQLIYYCPSTNRFCITSTLTPFTATNFFAAIEYYFPNQLTFQKMTTSTNRKQLVHQDTWLAMKKQWRIHTSLYANSHFKRLFYNQGIPLSLLPSEAGIPTKSMVWIQTDAFLWQGWILVQFIIPSSKGVEISFHDIFQSLKQEVRKGTFKIRVLPSLKNSHYSFAILEYLRQLQKLGILKGTANHTIFIKTGEITIPKNMEAALRNDSLILNKLEKNI